MEAARQAGHDLTWIAESSPGADDDAVLAAALSRVLLTFDKDFGKMAFRQGKAATCGVLLLRPRVLRGRRSLFRRTDVPLRDDKRP